MLSRSMIRGAQFAIKGIGKHENDENAQYHEKWRCNHPKHVRKVNTLEGN